jgi:hypothetical protein
MGKMGLSRKVRIHTIGQMLKEFKEIKEIVKYNEGSEKEARWLNGLGGDQSARWPVKFLAFRWGTIPLKCQAKRLAN